MKELVDIFIMAAAPLVFFLAALAFVAVATRQAALKRLLPSSRQWLLLGVLLLGIPGKALYDRYQQELGRRDAALVSIRAERDTLKGRVRRLEDSLGRQVRVAYKTKTVWDTLPPLIPDLLKPDAKPVPAAVLANVILVGREAVESCHTALSTCLVLQAVKDSVISNQAQEIAILQKRVPGRWDGLLQWGVRLGFFWLGTQTR